MVAKANIKAKGKKTIPALDAVLLPKQKAFVAEYLIDLNARQAAIRAGYSEHTATIQGCRLLTYPNIQLEIETASKKREIRTNVTQDRVITELAKIGFSDIRKTVKWGSGIAVPTEEGGEPVMIMNGLALVGSDQLDEDTAACIAEISETAQGIKIKLYDKRAALVDLGRHLGIFKDKLDLKVSGLEDLLGRL